MFRIEVSSQTNLAACRNPNFIHHHHHRSFIIITSPFHSMLFTFIPLRYVLSTSITFVGGNASVFAGRCRYGGQVIVATECGHCRASKQSSSSSTSSPSSPSSPPDSSSSLSLSSFQPLHRHPPPCRYHRHRHHQHLSCS